MESFDLDDYMDSSTLINEYTPIDPRFLPQPEPLPLTLFSLLPLRGYQAKERYEKGETVYISPSPLSTNLCNAYPLTTHTGLPFPLAVEHWRQLHSAEELFFYDLVPFRELSPQPEATADDASRDPTLIYLNQQIYRVCSPRRGLAPLHVRLTHQAVRRYLLRQSFQRGNAGLAL